MSENTKKLITVVPDVEYFLELCLFAPVIEEFIFRWLIFEIFDKKTWVPYLISFFAFTFAHYHQGENIIVFFLQYLPFLLLIYAYKKSNWKLSVPILLHFLANLSFFLILTTF